MENLSEKSADELRELLDEYGIKHGPVVDTTRSLYEKKLREAIVKAKKPSSDKTYYREEVQEEVTYVTRTPVRRTFGESEAYMRARPERTESEYIPEASYSHFSKSLPDYRREDFSNEPFKYSTPTSYRSSYLSSTPVTSKDIQNPAAPPSSAATKSSGLIPPWFQVVFFVVVLIFLYIVFSSMETNEPIKGIE